MSYINSLETHNGRIGKLGEDAALNFLIDKGHEIIERNYRNKLGEIDIITKYKNKIHIIEVKTSSSKYVRPEENMNIKKMRKVAKLGQMYCGEAVFVIDFIGVVLEGNVVKEIRYLDNLEIY